MTCFSSALARAWRKLSPTVATPTILKSALLCYSVVDQFAPAVSLCLHGAIRADGMDEFRQERTRCLVRSTSAAGEGLGGPKGAHMRSPHRMNRLALDGLLWMA